MAETDQHDPQIYLNRFEIRGREYAVYRDGGGMIGIDARGMRLGDVHLRRDPAIPCAAWVNMSISGAWEEGCDGRSF